MRDRFFITGLPRSRTAWLAVMMSTGDAICMHEPRGWEKWWQSEPMTDKCRIGISDSGLGFQLPRILAEYAPRTLIVERPPEEVEASLAALNTGLPRTNFVEILHKALKEVPNHPLVMRMPYHAIDDMRSMQKAFWHLCPGLPFDEGRYRELLKQNIQADYRSQISYPATHYKIPSSVVAA